MSTKNNLALKLPNVSAIETAPVQWCSFIVVGAKANEAEMAALLEIGKVIKQSAELTLVHPKPVITQCPEEEVTIDAIRVDFFTTMPQKAQITKAFYEAAEKYPAVRMFLVTPGQLLSSNKR